MIMNLYSAKTIEEYSKALYIKLKLIKIPESYNNNNNMLCYGKKKIEIRKLQTKLKLNIRTVPTN